MSLQNASQINEFEMWDAFKCRKEYKIRLEQCGLREYTPLKQ